MPGRFPPLLLIALVLLAGCMTPAPKDTPAEVPAPGSVAVSSTPPGAEVYLDNEYRGTTPVTVPAPAGSHHLELRLRDYQSWSKSIQVEGGLKVSVDTTLALLPVATTLPAPPVTTGPVTFPTTRPAPVPTTTATTPPTTDPTTPPTTFPTRMPIPTTTSVPKLAAPVPFSPADGQVFTGDRLRKTTFTWSAVPGADHYRLEVDSFVPSMNNWWGRDTSYLDVPATTYTWALWVGVGMPNEPVNLFRWHVSARNADPAANSPPSAWRNFTWNP